MAFALGDEATLRLSHRYENQLYNAATHPNVVPALIVTGFLGSGKTTLVQHILSQRPDLRMGVIINEVGQLDVDSQLVNAKQSNAAVGLREMQLAGGCACCTAYGDLEQALVEVWQRVTGAHGSGALDCLVVETSGVADAEPLAAALSKAGFRLDAVVAVVDAEAGLAALQQPVAVAQLRCADVVLINKCDLAPSLASLADLEDAVQALTPGTRMLRTRFGQLPVEAVLDFGPEAAPQASQHGEQPASITGSIPFLSHEPVPVQRVGATGGNAPRAGAKIAAQARAQAQRPADAQHHPHLHAHFASVTASAPAALCMAHFQQFVVTHLLKAAGLFRVKGMLQFAARREARYVFQLSGRARAECREEGVWEGPPSVQLVLIGTQRALLEALSERLQGCAQGRCGCHQHPGSSSCTTTTIVEPGMDEAVAELQRCVMGHDLNHSRMTVVPVQADGQSRGTSSASLPAPVLEFSIVPSPVHGIVAEEVNAAVMRAVNASGAAFLCCRSSPAVLEASTGLMHNADRRVAALQLGVRNGMACAEARELWQGMMQSCSQVLRKAYAHVHSCKCDVAAAAAAVASPHSVKR